MVFCTPFLSFIFYLFFCWIYAIVLVWCLGIRFHKWLLDFIYHHIPHQLLRSCLPGMGAFTASLITCLPDREVSFIKKEYCRCGPHPLQVTSSRVRPPLVKGVGHIGPLFLEFRGWPLWFMASIALWGPQHLAPEVVPVTSLHSEALSPECGRECQETGDCGPT